MTPFDRASKLEQNKWSHNGVCCQENLITDATDDESFYQSLQKPILKQISPHLHAS